MISSKGGRAFYSVHAVYDIPELSPAVVVESHPVRISGYSTDEVLRKIERSLDALSRPSIISDTEIND